MSAATRGALVGLGLAVAIAACARSAQPMSQAPGPVSTMPDPPQHAEISQLDAQLDAARRQLALPEAAPVIPLDGHAAPMSVAPSSAEDPACHPGATDSCRDTCTLADQICSDAARICVLAQQLPGDAWAAGKCSSGEQTCDAAHARCCGCQ